MRTSRTLILCMQFDITFVLYSTENLRQVTNRVFLLRRTYFEP